MTDTLITTEVIGPSGWPEGTRSQNAHAIAMLRSSRRVYLHDLQERTQVHIASRPIYQEHVDRLTMHIERLQTLVRAEDKA